MDTNLSQLISDESSAQATASSAQTNYLQSANTGLEARATADAATAKEEQDRLAAVAATQAADKATEAVLAALSPVVVPPSSDQPAT